MPPWIAAGRLAWIVGTLLAIPAAGMLWIAGGYASCGTDTTEPGALGDWACRAVVEPVAPWLLLCALPVVAIPVFAELGIRRGDRGLLVAGILAPLLVVAVAIFAILAVA